MQKLTAFIALGLLLEIAAVLGLSFLQMHRETGGRADAPAAGFKDVAPESGITFRMAFLPGEQGEKFKINLYDHGCGVAVADIDGDGFDDIYFVNQLGFNSLYKNRGDGTFVDVTKEAGVGLGDRVCVAATFADFNNDGLPDLFVTSTRGGNVLFKNLGNCRFKDVAEEAGVASVGHAQTAAFFDYDNDGYLDLFVTNTANWTAEHLDESHRYFPGTGNFFILAQSPKEENVLYHNNRDGTFTDVTAGTGLKGRGWGGDVAAFDYDEDGHIDLLVTNMFGASQLYRNSGNGSFSDVTKRVLGRTSWGAIGCKAFDYNNDGKLDLLIADMHSDMWMPMSKRGHGAQWDDAVRFLRDNEKRRYRRVMGAREDKADLEKRFADTFHIDYEQVIFGNTLFRNLGDGEFQEVTEPAGMETFWPWGIATGDFNNDGYEDVFLPSGMGYPFFYWPNRLLLNNGNETFSERSGQEGIDPPRDGICLEQKIGGGQAARSSRCAAVADFRNIGRLDIVTNNFNDRPYYYQNQFPNSNYISLRLRGTKSNRDAVGAVVRLSLGTQTMTRQVHAAGGYLSHSSRVLHFGLGDRTEVDQVTIAWPSGIRQQLRHPDLNKLHSIIEPVR